MSSTRDPFDRLGIALADVVRAAVAEAVAQMGVDGGIDTAVLVDVEEAARRLGLGATTVKRKIACGDLESVLVDRRRLVAVKAIAAFVDHLTAAAG